MNPLATLLHMLTYARPCGSATERAFIAKYIAVLPGAYRDANHNWHVKVDDAPILWSCHTDTVHRTEGRQTVHYDGRTGLVGLSRKSKRTSTCLGADDTAGVFLMTEMIKREVPGYYVFHFGEEVGGIGSGDMAKEHSTWLANTFHCAIALDRGGYRDIITHQGGRMTASTAFADSLAASLNHSGPFLYGPSDRGIYTDTAEYSDAIGECTNVSVGYHRAHSEDETLDCDHVLALLESFCSVRIGDLAIVRKAGEDDRPVSRYVEWSDWDDLTDTDLTLPAVDMHPTTDTYSTEEMAELLDDRSDDRSLYLWPEYGDVQAALRRYRQ